MMEVKDPSANLKLFGQMIPLAADGESLDISGDELNEEGSSGTVDVVSDHDLGSEMEEDEDGRESGPGDEQTDEQKGLQMCEPTKKNEQEKIAQPSMLEESIDPETSLEPNESRKTPPIDEQNGDSGTSTAETEESGKSNAQGKTLKKPDKILPCPRCNSMETKFCYYNNYNINQPRHFCKSCQRYWTDGGTMRNVPVGAGRRKNKNSANQYRHITISEALQTAAANGIHTPKLNTNGTVLNFGSDATLSDSIASVMSIAEKTMWNGVANGFHKPGGSEVRVLSRVEENGDDPSTVSSTVGSNSTEETGKGHSQDRSAQALHGFPPQIKCLPGVPWPFPWNAAVPQTAFCHPALPMFYPASYWNCPFPGAWPVPLMSPPSSSPKQTTTSSGPNSPTLGKHSRDGEMLEPQSSAETKSSPRQRTSERNIWVPKTLRIDDPQEAAKSSIWATLGIKNELANKGGMFKGFQQKPSELRHVNGTSTVLQANPAALSRSLNFHESS